MFQGSIVALVTPMHSDGSLDLVSASKLVDFHIENDTDALVILGSTGEATTLSDDEKILFTKSIVEFSNAKIPVIVGANANSTDFTKNIAIEYAKLGIDGILLSTPAYVKPTQQGLIIHFNKIAEAIDLPIIIYNVPSRTGCDMVPETIINLSAVNNIVSIKEASGDLTRIEKLAINLPSDFTILSGEDSLTLDMIKKGAHGAISVTANASPKLYSQALKDARNGDFANAMSSWSKLTSLHEKLFVESNPIPVKWLLEEMGLIGSGIRLPLTRLDMKYRDEVQKAYKASL